MKQKIKRVWRQIKADPLGFAIDLLHAHRKLVLAGASVVLIQVVDQETVDWIIGILGTLLVGGVPNDELAVERVYPNKRRIRR